MNKNTKEYLPLIDVSLKGTTIGTTTDAMSGSMYKYENSAVHFELKQK